MSVLPTEGLEDMLPTKGVEALQALSDLYEDCEACEILCEHRKRVVFGGGSVNGPLMVIAEGPGESEDETGEVLIGESGRLFMDLLALAWPQTEEMAEIRDIADTDEFFEELRDYFDDYIFWTNIVLCRPPENRDPSPAERKACRDRLQRTIYAVDPLLIIGLGKFAVSQLVGSAVQITKKRGQLYDVTIPSPVTGEHVRFSLLALLHPAYLLRQGDQALMKKKKGQTYDTLQDLKYAVGLMQKHSKFAFKTDFPEEP